MFLANAVYIYSKQLVDRAPAQLIDGNRYRPSVASGTFAYRSKEADRVSAVVSALPELEPAGKQTKG